MPIGRPENHGCPYFYRVLGIDTGVQNQERIWEGGGGGGGAKRAKAPSPFEK